MSVKTVALTSSTRRSLPRSVLRVVVLSLLRGPLESLSEGVYTSLVPTPIEVRSGARSYLSDLWREAPLSGAVLHTVLALVLLFSPLALGIAWRPLGALSEETLERWHLVLSHHPLYLVRLAYYGGRGHALVAILRDAPARRVLLQKGAK